MHGESIGGPEEEIFERAFMSLNENSLSILPLLSDPVSYVNIDIIGIIGRNGESQCCQFCQFCHICGVGQSWQY